MATVISEKITINGVGSDIIFDGFDFTANGYIEVKNATSVTVRNCRVYNMNLTAIKNYWLKIYGDIETKLVIENNFFGSNPTSGSNRMYNLIEPTAKLMNGSSISNNYFVDDCCYHNVINVYGCVEQANVNINGNVIAMTAGGIRIGVKGSPVCTINVRDNKVLALNPNYSDEGQGIVTIEGYGKETTSFANMAIVMSGNEIPCEQTIYAGYGSNDLILTNNNMPKVIVDGKVVDVVIYKW